MLNTYWYTLYNLTRTEIKTIVDDNIKNIIVKYGCKQNCMALLTQAHKKIKIKGKNISCER